MGNTIKIPPPSDGKRLAIYTRKSDLSSGESRGQSCQQQYQHCLLAAKALAFEVTERLTFIEEDGNKGHWYWRDAEGRHPAPFRPELTRLMEAVDRGEVDAVMVWRTDRLYRDELVAGFLLRKLREKGVRLFSRSQDLFIHTASGFQSATTEACANKAYRDKISEDVTRDHETKAANGLLPRNPACLGFRSGGKGSGVAVPIMDEIEVVRSIFRWYVYGDPGEAPLSARAISIRLMEAGLRTSVGAKGHKCKNSSFVHIGSVTAVLKNAFYAGQIEHNGHFYPTQLFDVPNGEGHMAPVVSEDTFLAAKELLEHGRAHERDKRAKLLNGVIVCPECGRRMYSQAKSSTAKSLHCSYRIGKFAICTGNESYRTLHSPDLEIWVREHLAPLLAAELQAIRALQRGDESRVELASVERRLGEMVRAEGESLSALMSSMDAVQFAAVARKLKADREVVERHADELRARVRREATESHDPFALLSADDALLRQALLRAVRWISVTKRGIIVLTKAGAYIGAYLARGDANIGRGGHRKPKILPPSVEATMECRSWIPDPEKFLEGARKLGGRWGRVPTDAELFPDFLAEQGEAA